MERKHHRRTKWIRACLMLSLTGLMARLTYIQLVESPTYIAKASKMWDQTDELKAVRGTIYDRNGFKLAYTSVAYIPYADLNQMKDAREHPAKNSLIDASGTNSDSSLVKEVPYPGDPQKYAELLSPFLKIPETDIYKKLTPTDPKIVGVDITQTPIDEDTKKRIVALGLPGIHFRETQTRVYPNQSLASHVLGFVNQEGKGIYGIEAEYNKELSGKDGSDTYLKDANGNPLPYTKEKRIPAQNGHDVYLTIDAQIQNYAEQALDDVVKQYQPKNTSIIVADPKTGEILAMANRPTYDPNHYNLASQTDLDNNRAVNATFEPGSTFKILTLTAGIAENKVNIDDTFQSGSITVSGRTIHDWNWTGWGRISFRKGVANSSNVGFVIMGQKVGKDLMSDYIHKFGYDELTGIDLPDEAHSILFPEKPLTDLHLATESFGQGAAVTPIQQISAVSAVANGGNVMKPFLMKKIVDADTQKVLKQNEPVVRSQVADPKTMQTVRGVLEDDVREDESHAGYLPGYHVAGKTGTAQVPDGKGGYYSDQYICSFIGFAPANDPRLEIYVTVDYPQHAEQFGNVVATPAAKKVFSLALPYLNVQPDGQKVLQATTAGSHQVKYVPTPDVMGMSRSAAIHAADQKGLLLQTIGSSGNVTSQWPKPGTPVLATQPLLIIFGNGRDGDGMVTLPDLTGLSLRDSADLLNQLGIQFQPKGDGYVISQNKPPSIYRFS